MENAESLIIAKYDVMICKNNKHRFGPYYNDFNTKKQIRHCELCDVVEFSGLKQKIKNEGHCNDKPMLNKQNFIMEKY